ncbi:UNVERIFIED_CONTAM: hypothetical protein Sradi_1858200 [Sesamum radiatum]|uniref:Uncharacterized protein n=1 Tax=Sesamum radiatum TaxID=300843 RepID=A0AAW2TXK5_SESRA
MHLGHNLGTCRRILDGEGHPRPASALRRPHAPARLSHVQCSLGASSAHAFVVAVLCASLE